jgi:hypothetical protein
VTFTGKIDQLTIDHQTKIFDATEELILLGQDYAFVKKDDQIIGIICLEGLLKEYHAGDVSEATIEKFMNPFFLFSKNQQ